LSKQNAATVSNISVPSKDKLLDHTLGIKGKPGLSMHLKILLGYKINFEGLYHEGFYKILY
jgi:hypothetical protein